MLERAAETGTLNKHRHMAHGRARACMRVAQTYLCGSESPYNKEHYAAIGIMRCPGFGCWLSLSPICSKKKSTQNTHTHTRQLPKEAGGGGLGQIPHSQAGWVVNLGLYTQA